MQAIVGTQIAPRIADFMLTHDMEAAKGRREESAGAARKGLKIEGAVKVTRVPSRTAPVLAQILRPIAPELRGLPEEAATAEIKPTWTPGADESAHRSRMPS